MVSEIKISSTNQMRFKSLNKNLKIKSVTIETKIKQVKIILCNGAIPTFISIGPEFISKKLIAKPTIPKAVTIFKGVNLNFFINLKIL